VTLTALATAAAVLTGALAAAEVRGWRAGARVRHRLRPGAAPRPLPLPAPLRQAFRRAGLAADADRLVLLWVGGISLALLLSLLVTSGRILIAVGLVAGPGGLVLAGGRIERRRTAQLPEALDAVAAGLRGGLALPAAIAGAASVGPPLGEELAGLAREVESGRPLTEAVARWQAAADEVHTSLAGAALAVAADVGGPGARAVDGAAASLRERLSSEAETAALATQGRVSAAVLTLAPIAFAFVLSSVDSAAARFLLGTPIGWLCIAAGLALDATGAWWMARLVRRAR
jgi:tight adherence protein B